MSAGFIKEVKYPEWLANVVVVQKKGGKWRVCVDYMDLNEACSKDIFPLPRIDHIVDASVGHGMLSFLDSLSGYNQIPMHPPDAEKTTFICATQAIFLQSDALWFEECRGNLSATGDQDISPIDGPVNGSPYLRYA